MLRNGFLILRLRSGCILLGVLALFWFASASTPAGAAPGDANRAALVVRYGDGHVETSCVSFPEASITGEELLLRSGLTIIVDYNAGLGGAVCSINGSGCAYPKQDCFCRCQGQNCEYWAYYHGVVGGWQYSQVGASGHLVTNGALEAWSWGPGNFSSGTLPPAIGFAEVCVPPTATPTATVTPTATPMQVTPSPTPTASPDPNAATRLDAVLEATSTRLASGTCAVLKWRTWNADHVTLDGASVIAQDRLEVCPEATHRYVLVATNSAGQATRSVVLEVQGPMPAQGTNTPIPPSTPPPFMASEPTAALVSAAQATTTPEPPRAGALTVARAQELPTARPKADTMPLQAAPQRAMESTAVGSAASSAASAAAETAAGLRRRQTATDGPTPTPILAAHVSSLSPEMPRTGSSESSGARLGESSRVSPVAPDRAFRLALLPGYAAYLLMAGALAGLGVWVTSKKTSRVS